jgi:hypothetical protein
MADYNSGLPIRSEADGLDERVHVKIVDGTNPAVNQVTVDSDKNLHVEIHGNDPAGVDRVVRTSELGALTPDGVYDASNNTKPGNSAIIVHSRAVSPGDAQSVIRATGINSTVNTDVWAQDVAIRDEQGNPFSASNPLPVTLVDSEGDEINDYKAAPAIIKDATDNHDYTVTALKTLKLQQIEASASGKMKMEVKVETGVATNVFTTKWVMFNSTANPNLSLWIKEQLTVAAGVRVRVTLKNLDNQPQDLYSTISGHEI